MIKLVYVVRRKSGMTREEFQQYWREHHGPLVRSVADSLGIRRNVQTHTAYEELNARAPGARGQMQPPYDGLVEVWYDDLAELQRRGSSSEGQEAVATLIEDEAKFIDFSRSALWFADEHVMIDG